MRLLLQRLCAQLWALGILERRHVLDAGASEAYRSRLVAAPKAQPFLALHKTKMITSRVFVLMPQIIQILKQRIVSAFVGPISVPKVVVYTASCLVGFGFVTAPFGLYSGYLKYQPIKQPSKILQVVTTALILPGLVEEFFYRVILLPNPTIESLSTGIWALWIVVDLILFTAMHLLNPRKTLHDLRFLVMAAFLGVACIVAYLGTGSIYSPWIVHWIAVVVWILVFGGLEKVKYQRLNSDCNMQ
eukprot:TRINITY_DN5673_c1_g1_i12.p2 TRINITY_DN5673_c1_g1~~TRINITY_DN5673_c1_g1_i12.p2  ORF type:complete len:245 (-),score=10.12 TRINITY_DN5673_c1_g1_i12:528-1262(-)